MKTKTKKTKKSKYITMHEVSEAFTRLAIRLEKKLGKQLKFNFEIQK